MNLAEKVIHEVGAPVVQHEPIDPQTPQERAKWLEILRDQLQHHQDKAAKADKYTKDWHDHMIGVIQRKIDSISNG